MLCIASVPPKSVNRTNFYEDFTISASKGLVNLVAAEPLGRQLLGRSRSPNTPIAIKPSP
jgi:hypothetical protein